MFLYLRRGCRAAVALPAASRVNAALDGGSYGLSFMGWKFGVCVWYHYDYDALHIDIQKYDKQKSEILLI